MEGGNRFGCVTEEYYYTRREYLRKKIDFIGPFIDILRWKIYFFKKENKKTRPNVKTQSFSKNSRNIQITHQSNTIHDIRSIGRGSV